MCRICRQQCRVIRFDFQCKKFYHDYCTSSSYTQPDLICFFNPALHRPGFRGFDTWQKTIESAINSSASVLITASTRNECQLDMERVQRLARHDGFEIIQTPKLNPYKSSYPERNFASDSEVPIFFKNQYFFIVRQTKLIEL